MAEPLVCLAGIASDEATFAAVGACLEGAAQVLPFIPSGDSIDAMAADILARAPDRFALAGHSLGGYVALAMIAIAPERITRLALLNSSAAADTPEQAARREALVTRVSAQGYDNVIDQLVPALVHPDAPLDTALLGVIRAMLLRAGAARFAQQQRAASARPDRLAMLHKITVPTLVIAGGKDRIVAPDASTDIAQAIPGSTMVMLENAGHLPSMEHPGTVADAMKRWLSPASP